MNIFHGIKDWYARFKTAYREKSQTAATPARPAAQPDAPAAPSKPAAARPWDAAVHASCWDNGGSKRLMNLLSPKFSGEKFRAYVEWMESRGCDAAHVILINGGDGEGAGWNCAANTDHAALARERMQALSREGFAIVPWLVTDDSAAHAKDLFAEPERRIKTLADAGLFDLASYVVLGLEMDEPDSYPGGSDGWPKVAAALRKVYGGKIGTHHKSGNSFPYAPLGEIVLGQLDPGATEADAKKQIRAIRAAGRYAVGFEYARGPARALAQAALAEGAIGVGNW